MKIKLLSFLLISGIFVSSCKKSIVPEDKTGFDISTLNVSSAFSWATSRDVTFNLGISDTQFGNRLHVISIYSGDPKSGGTLLSRGSATITTPYSTKISLPNTINEVYIERYSPNGQVVNQKVAITSEKVSVSIGENTIVTTAAVKASNFALSVAQPKDTSPDCSLGCDVQIAQTTANSFDMVSGKTYCVTGSNITVKVQNTNGGTMRICGTGVTVDGLKMASNVTVIVATGASVNFTNLNWEGPSVFKNFGTVTTGNVKVLSSFLNQGIMSVNGDFVTESKGDATNYGTINVSSNFNSGASFTNEGILKVNGNFNSNGTPDFVNNKTLETKQTTIAGDFTNTSSWTVSSGDVMFNNGPKVNNSGTITALTSKFTATGTFTNDGSVVVQNYVQNAGDLINNCKFITLNLFDNNAKVLNKSYIQVDNESNLKGSTILRNGALFKTKNIVSLDGTLKGEGNTSLFKVTGASFDNINNGNAGKISGTIVYADPTNKIKPAAFANPAVSTTGAGIFIEKNSCNEGNGNQVVEDTDGDGVPDTKDEFPTDPTKAYVNYSFNYDNGGTTIAFEDNFPVRGDYDMNDIVITYRYKIISNAANKVVHVEANYSLRATGGNYKNGAGIQFDLPLASVSNIKGAEVEVQPTSKDLVLILFKDSRTQQPLWSTIPSEGASPAVAYDISFDVKPEVTVEQFGIGNYNPFIWNGSFGFGRGYETHLKNKKPTDMADLSLFQSGDDGTIGKGQVGAGFISYVSKTQNLPWAIELPISNFKYPIEKTAITSAYQSFSKWASSLGESNVNWYNDGNVDVSKIFPIK